MVQKYLHEELEGSKGIGRNYIWKIMKGWNCECGRSC